jgi:hypothetical protein
MIGQEGTDVAIVITRRRFDFYDIGTIIGQYGCAIRAREHTGEIGNFEVGERFHTFISR